MQTSELAVQELDVPLAVAQTGKSAMDGIEDRADWPLLSRLPMRLTAGIPLARFKVRDLLALQQGQMIGSTWTSTDDVPLRIGSVQLSWSEFEVVEERMAVRLTRLA